jgi:hypothetical protein
MLIWHRHLWLIDHGAALYFHHTASNHLERSRDRFPMIKDHVLLPFASTLQDVDTQLAGRLTADSIERIVTLIPDTWLHADISPNTDAQQRHVYTEYLVSRLESRQVFLEEAIRAQSTKV